MKIFVGYGYNARDAWIEKLVFPLIKAFGADVSSGKEMEGKNLGDGISELIKTCDAVLGFTTRRISEDADEDPNRTNFGTHRWVTDELTTAFALKVPLAEVREKGIQEHGILAGHGYIEYEPDKREQCLVALADLIGRWVATGGGFEVHLLPEEFASAARGRLRDKNLLCQYQLLGPNDLDPGPLQKATIIQVDQRLAIRVRNVPKNSLIRVEVECGHEFFSESAFQQLEARTVHMKL